MKTSKIPYFVAIAGVIFAASLLVNYVPDEPIQSTSESTKIVGLVTLVLTDEDGVIKQYIQTKNAIHDDGFNQIISTTASARYARPATKPSASWRTRFSLTKVIGYSTAKSGT